MKLNSTENYLTLILRALDTAIITELTSAPSRGAADLIRTALLELLKR